MRKTALSVLLVSLLLSACAEKTDDAAAPAGTPAAAPAVEPKILHVYNWSDYIAEDTLANFEAETGIKVVYDVFDSNELLEAKLVSGSTGYDVVVPSLSFLGRQIQVGVFMPVDRQRLSNYGNLDAALLQRIAQTDPGNTYGVPYLWGTTGIGYNVGKLQEIFGADFRIDSWDLVFKPELIAKAAGCGVAFLDTPQELVPIALNYLGEEPNSFDEAVIAKAETLLAGVRPYIRYFHSSQFINDLANGDICVAVGWSGDIFQAGARAEEAENGIEVGYAIPKEGAPMWFDMLAIPKDSKHPGNAHRFIDYLLRPEVMANIQNHVAYASPNTAALPMVDEELKQNPAVYPDADTDARLFTFVVLPPEVDRLYSRLWTRLKTGR
jgi:putrescine transport system substrate-binding protein